MHYNVWRIKNNLLEINPRLVRKLSWIEKLTHIISDKDSFYVHFDLFICNYKWDIDLLLLLLINKYGSSFKSRKLKFNMYIGINRQSRRFKFYSAVKQMFQFELV